MHTFHAWQQLFGAFTRRPRWIYASSGARFIALETADGCYDFENMNEIRYVVAIGDTSAHRLPF